MFLMEMSNLHQVADANNAKAEKAKEIFLVSSQILQAVTARIMMSNIHQMIDQEMMPEDSKKNEKNDVSDCVCLRT